MAQSFPNSALFIRPVAGVVSSVPSAQGAANVTATATAAVVGVQLGDGIKAFPTAALYANGVFLNAYVTASAASATATGTVTFVFSSTAAATPAAVTFNLEITAKSTV